MMDPSLPVPFLKRIHSDIFLPGEVENDVLNETLSGTTDSMEPTAATSQFSLLEDTYTIGRSLDNIIRVVRSRVDVSRKHATLKRDGTRYYLFDHSTHGTFVNEQRIEAPHRLESGDVLGFGDSPRMLRFVDPANAVVKLTPRQREVLRYIVLGKQYKEIAKALNVDIDTVGSHVKEIFARLDVRSRAEATKVAQDRGLLDDPS